MSRPVLVAACLCAALLAPAASAQAQTTVTVPGVPAAGPAKYDKSFVTKIGPSSAKTVLVLVPGFSAGAGRLHARRPRPRPQVPGLQVWALDRRSQALEDTSVFERGLKGQATPKQVFDYYLGWITDQSIQPRYQPPSTESLGFMSEWGLPTHIQDLRRVILSAKRQGKRVILGGHSLGASMTAIYAAWDFNGRPGYRDVDGLMLIDGGALGTFDDVETTAQIRRRLAQVRKQPLADLVGVGLPWAQGIFTGLGGPVRAQGADRAVAVRRLRPAAPAVQAARAGDEPRLPRARLRPRHVAAQLGLIHLRAGRLARRAIRATGRTARSRRSPAWRSGSATSRSTASSGSSRCACRSTSTAPTSSSATR
jgi:pimeloyl-ACP methyl ester carboxylesterase